MCVIFAVAQGAMITSVPLCLPSLCLFRDTRSLSLSPAPSISTLSLSLSLAFSLPFSFTLSSSLYPSLPPSPSFPPSKINPTFTFLHCQGPQTYVHMRPCSFFLRACWYFSDGRNQCLRTLKAVEEACIPARVES